MKQTLKEIELRHKNNMEGTKLSHKFALKMATIICWAVVSVVVLLGISFAEITIISLGITLAIAIIFGILTFFTARSACL